MLHRNGHRTAVALAAAAVLGAALVSAAPVSAQPVEPTVQPTISGGAPIATSTEGYTIADVTVEATAGTTVAARDIAFREGQRKALARLLERLGATGRLDPAAVSDADLDAIVERFQVNAEQSSPGRYAATLTYVFRGPAVQALLSGAAPAIATAPGAGHDAGTLMPSTGVGAAGALNVLVPIQTAADWYDIQARLARLSGIVDAAVASLSAREVVIELRGGSAETLNPLLAREGLVLRPGPVALELVRLGG